MRINQLGDHKVPRKPEVIKRIKNTNTIAAKMKVVVERMIQSYKTNETRPLLTIFVYKSLQSEIISSFLHEMQKENVTLFANKALFFSVLSQKYDELYTTIHSHCTPHYHNEIPK